MAIPEFKGNGFLPEGLYMATEAQITFRFGTSSRQRRKLVLRIRRWIELARQVGASRLLIDGSFVTHKISPGDVDSVILLPEDFSQQLANGSQPAIELEKMLITNQPERSMQRRMYWIGRNGLIFLVEPVDLMVRRKDLWRFSYDNQQ